MRCITLLCLLVPAAAFAPVLKPQAAHRFRDQSGSRLHKRFGRPAELVAGSRIACRAGDDDEDSVLSVASGA